MQHALLNSLVLMLCAVLISKAYSDDLSILWCPHFSACQGSEYCMNSLCPDPSYPDLWDCQLVFLWVALLDVLLSGIHRALLLQFCQVLYPLSTLSNAVHQRKMRMLQGPMEGAHLRVARLMVLPSRR